MREGRWRGRRYKRRRREREKRKKNGREDQQKLDEAELEKGVMEDGTRFSPMRPGILWGRSWSSHSDQGSLRVGFMPPLLDYGWASPFRLWAPQSGDYVNHLMEGPPKDRTYSPAAKTLHGRGPASGALHAPGAQTSTCLTPLLSSPLLPTPGFTDAFNMDTRRPQIIPGSRESFFGYTVQQHDISGKKW